MALQVDREQLDTFCLQLFRTLDVLGLLPLQLWAKPNEFEKYPRLLFGSIQRYNDVEAGFKEWESRVLRDAPYRKEEHYPSLEALRRSLLQHGEVFTKKANLQHLRTSLYARVFNYLYPRRVLANAYCIKHRGNPNAVESEFVAKALPQSIEAEVEKLNRVYRNKVYSKDEWGTIVADANLGSDARRQADIEGKDEWGTIVADAKASLIANAAYYRKVLCGEEPVAPPEEEAEAVETEQAEEESV